MLREMADLGFEYAELSHGIRVTLVPGILQAVQEGVMKISTTHNFCPLPPGIMNAAPNLYQPSSPGSVERDQWRRYTAASLDFGNRVKARVLITHMGSEFFFFLSPARKLSALSEKLEEANLPLRDNAQYMAELQKLLAKLRKGTPQHYRRIREGITEMAALATECGIKFGCENREGLLELPLDEDMETFIASMDSLKVVGGWHDTGHARIKEMEGVITHSAFLEKNHHRLLGFHLHDVSAEGKDHQPLGSGSVDWPMVRKYIRPEHILVLELSPRLTVEQVKQSKIFLEKWLADGVTPPASPAQG